MNDLSPPKVMDRATPYVQRFENNTWNWKYVATIWQIVRQHQNYEIYRYFPQLPWGNFDNQQEDKPGNNDFTTLLSGCFDGS